MHMLALLSNQQPSKLRAMAAPYHHRRPSARDQRFFLAVAVFLTAAACAGVAEARYGAGRSTPVAAIVSEDLYSSLFPHRDDVNCSKGFYTYASFIRATRKFPKFGGAGDLVTRKREIAAFLAQISQETTGGWAAAPDGPYMWGLCFKDEISPQSSYCDATNKKWPCYPGKSYNGRGPIQLSWNYNYGPAGEALGFDGLRNPELVSTCPDTAFQTALWFWMTPRQPMPSCHQVMVGEYCPSTADAAANRTAGFGLVTNIINGVLECNIANNERVNGRIGFYRRYCQVFGIHVGPNLDCARQLPYS